MNDTEWPIEQALLETLHNTLKYRYRPDIRDRATLEQNFRSHFEALNQVQLTDNEFARLLDGLITSDVFKAATMLRHINTFSREDGTPLHYTLVNIKEWCKNTFEVTNQIRINTDNSYHRYDIFLLINGIPVVQIELKRLSVPARRAMEQIVKYKNDPGNSYRKTLMCFTQLFVVSNGNDTWYFANNNTEHFSFDADERFLPRYYHASRDNEPISKLHDFAQHFLAKCTLARMISRYMVLVETEQRLIMMRPYQIYAVQAIVDCIEQHCGNGYIWHTTGSGKTLTSFKAATLLKDNPDIEKCLFVVDRKDLDKQTREEFNRFQEGCVEENTTTGTLVARLLSHNYADKVIVTTIQKLGLALTEASHRNYKKQLMPLRDKRMVFIFDECHRSQFGKHHEAIKNFFPNAQLFGFTGTPIFADNASYQQIDGQKGSSKTTADIFQQELHAYTITNAIHDGNVLRFHVDYYKPQSADNTIPKKVIVKAILDKHNASTCQRKYNALLATASINDAIAYVDLFEQEQARQQAQDASYRPLNIACVFSPPADGNTDVRQYQEDLPQEKADNTIDPQQKKAALIAIMQAYNRQYGSNFTLDTFDGYYKDVQDRIKKQKYANRDVPHSEKIDITIVVDMLLTGFDAPYLNTLYVDKNLRYHGLVQAFSRTNRVLNESKPHGNIVDFRQQQDKVDEAIALFSGEMADRAKEIWLAEPAQTVIAQLDEAVGKLNAFMHSQGLACAPEQVNNLKGDAARAQFINLFKRVQRCAVRLEQYTDLNEAQREEMAQLMPPQQLQGFKGMYLTMAQHLKVLQRSGADPATEAEAEAMDMQLTLFASALIDYDYIIKLISDYTQGKPDKQTITREQLIGIIAAEARFIDQRDDIAAYVDTLTVGEGMSKAQVYAGFEAFQAKKQQQAVASIAATYHLPVDALQAFVDAIVRRNAFDDDQLTALFAPLALGWRERWQQKNALMRELIPLLYQRNGDKRIHGLDSYEQQ